MLNGVGQHPLARESILLTIFAPANERGVSGFFLILIFAAEDIDLNFLIFNSLFINQKSGLANRPSQLNSFIQLVN